MAKPVAKKHITAKKKDGYIEAIGRRKTSVARVRLIQGGADSKGEKASIVVNEKALDKYFPLGNHRRIILSPFENSGVAGAFKATVKVVGGGISSQAQAIRHGIAKALVEFDLDLRKKLKSFGYLTGDPRMVERKKYGLKKARKAPQWSKR